MLRLLTRARKTFAAAAAPLMLFVLAAAPIAAQEDQEPELEFATYKLANGETVVRAPMLIELDGDLMASAEWVPDYFFLND